MQSVYEDLAYSITVIMMNMIVGGVHSPCYSNKKCEKVDGRTRYQLGPCYQNRKGEKVDERTRNCLGGSLTQLASCHLLMIMVVVIIMVNIKGEKVDWRSRS